MHPYLKEHGFPQIPKGVVIWVGYWKDGKITHVCIGKPTERNVYHLCEVVDGKLVKITKDSDSRKFDDIVFS